jgi:endonuclease/exonuclease/phosphatase family metal-dependent hydrolase
VGRGGWLAFGAVLLAASGAPAAAEPPPTLRAVTLNLFHGGPSSGLTGDGGHLEARLQLVAAELRALRPDVVALQEASVGRGRGNVAARLAADLGLHHVHVPATSRVFPLGLLNRVIVTLMNFAEGPAVLSRFPITGWAVHDLPRCERSLDPRVVLEAQLAAPWGALRLYSTHTARDACQHRRVAELVVAGRGRLPSILMGDFNAGEEAPSITGLVDRAGLVDAFRVANPLAPGLTVWQRIEAETSTVFRRVDYVFVLPGTSLTARVTASRVVLNAPGRLGDGRPLWASDHYGVLADLELSSEGASTAPSEASPSHGLRGQSPRSNGGGNTSEEASTAPY